MLRDISILSLKIPFTSDQIKKEIAIEGLRYQCDAPVT